MIKYENLKDFQHDYILRIRPDTWIPDTFYDKFNFFEQHQLEVFFDWDWCFFGKYDIMSHICKLVLCYGKYNYLDVKHSAIYTGNILDLKSRFTDIDYLDLYSRVWDNWHESPEVQLVEHTMHYIYINNISADKLSSTLNAICFIPDNKSCSLPEDISDKEKITGLLM